MTKFEYQVEYQDDEDKTHVEPFQGRRSAALAKARRMSNKHMVAYVVACKWYDGDRMFAACGHKSYGQGLVIETEGEGFKSE